MDESAVKQAFTTCLVMGSRITYLMDTFEIDNIPFTIFPVIDADKKNHHYYESLLNYVGNQKSDLLSSLMKYNEKQLTEYNWFTQIFEKKKAQILKLHPDKIIPFLIEEAEQFHDNVEKNQFLMWMRQWLLIDHPIIKEEDWPAALQPQSPIVYQFQLSGLSAIEPATLEKIIDNTTPLGSAYSEATGITFYKSPRFEEKSDAANTINKKI
jgi:hypothetical protein